MSHKASALERGDVLCCQFEPFPIFVTALEPAMPVQFDTCRVIGLDAVDDSGLFGQLNGQLLFATPHSVATTDLIVATRLEEVDGAELGPISGWSGGNIIPLNWTVLGADLRDIVVTLALFTPRSDGRYQFRPRTEPIERVVARERSVLSPPHLKFGFHWQATKLTDKQHQFL